MHASLPFTVLKLVISDESERAGAVKAFEITAINVDERKRLENLNLELI